MTAIDAMAAGPIGYFGKIPSKGDFVTANLPGSFIDPWDGWLRLTLVHSRERLGDQAARIAFLSSPVWRFVLTPGVCGPQGWAGVIASSADRVGRTYPLTLAAALPLACDPAGLPGRWAPGFERLIDLALMMLKDDAAVDRAAASLQRLLEGLPLPEGNPSPFALPHAAALGPGDARVVSRTPAGPAFEQARQAALNEAGGAFSLMWQTDWGRPPVAIIGHLLPDTSRCLTPWEAS
jgi:type VI secretion system protein ImpM